MSSIQYEITLDLKRDYHQVLVMKEGDVNSREILITIVDNGKIFDITNHNIKVKWHKPNHNYIVFNDCTITDNSKVLITCTEQMLIDGGIAKCEIVLYDIDNLTVLSTMSFDVSIKDSIINNKDIESSYEFGALNNLILSNKDLNDSLKQLEESVEEAESIRVFNETNRVSAEGQRQTDTATAITNANTAATNANKATDDANNATTAANTATENANDATKKANTAIEKMEALMKDDNIIHSDDLGVAGGVATLDENGNIPSSQLPSFVDDVLDGTYDSDNEQFLDLNGNVYTPESGKIYVDIDKRITYRWSGSTYVDIGSSLALGTTSSTAFPGDRGLSLEERMTDIEEYHNNIPAKDIKFDNSNTPLLGANVQSALEDLTKEATQTTSGLLSADDKKRIDNYADIQTIDATLFAANWVGNSAPYTQIITVENLSSYNNCSVTMPSTSTVEQENAIADAEISSITYDDTVGLTFTANGIKPTINIPIQLCVGTSMNVVEIPKYFGETPVTGVKGNAETDYRNGDVNITPDDIGALPVDGDSKDNTVSFAENEELENISSGENHKTIFGKISKAISTLISHINTKAITSIQNLHPLGHVQVYDEKQDITGTNQCSVPSMYLFQDEIDTINTNLSNIGTIYHTDVDITNPNGIWTIGAQLTLQPGTYIILHRGYSLSESIRIGKHYNIGDYISSANANESASYIEIQNYTEKAIVQNYIIGNSEIFNGISAIRIA